MKKLVKNKKGFTLIEIIVVLIIMGILLAIAVPSVMNYVGKAEDQRDLSTARVGFMGAQTVLLQEHADSTLPSNTPQGDVDNILAGKIDKDSVSEDTGVTFNAVHCVVANNVVTQCSIQVTANGKWGNFVVNGTAEMSEKAAVTAPNVIAPTPAP